MPSRLEADPAFGWGGRWLEEGQELLIEVAEGGVVDEERVVDFGESAEDGLVGGEDFTLFDEGADDEDGHLGSRPTAKDGGGHQSTVLGKGPRQTAASSVP